MTALVHIWTTNAQPATKWRMPEMPDGRYFRTKPLALVRCINCRKKRRAKNCAVKAYYDTVHTFCVKGGCARER